MCAFVYVYIVVISRLDLCRSTVVDKQHIMYTFSIPVKCIYVCTSGVLSREVQLYKTDNLSTRMSSVDRFNALNR